MGGYVALAIARRAKDRVLGLALFDTQAGADDDAAREKRAALAAEVESGGTDVLAREMLPRLLSSSSPDECRKDVEQMIRRASPAGAAAALRGLARRPPAFDVLKSFERNVLVVVGENDAITPPARAEEMAAAARHAQLVLVPGAGHLAHIEAKERVNAALVRFLSSVAF